MAKIYLVRHGQASAGWGADIDPGLSALGRQQAQEAAKILALAGPVQILSSPMARALETARPLCELWQTEPVVELRVAEIPSPTEDLGQRTEWLHKIMQDKWPNLGSDLQRWRRRIIDTVEELTEDTVIFSHFIAINVLVGAATDNDLLVNFFPDNASITIFEVYHNHIHLVERGKEAGTIIR
ncbi:MAG: histidine phosphatase family protein [Proteobacteria bacterium]|nr:histidine phosphatase family protein [Pseudomonadota bacterium]MBU1389788.1 histidine phosphatase family protein [Pseudomonadota bacterium]MBU1543797.1 histidine phosphatase family protein [Pseudomonadota bacterium]MBU2431464.1 histidine phosphatase family protein [Pseudomonadota bacterium]